MRRRYSRKSFVQQQRCDLLVEGVVKLLPDEDGMARLQGDLAVSLFTADRVPVIIEALDIISACRVPNSVHAPLRSYTTILINSQLCMRFRLSKQARSKRS